MGLVLIGVLIMGGYDLGTLLLVLPCVEVYQLYVHYPFLESLMADQFLKITW